MVKTYFDGSGKEDDPQSKFVTIAGFAAEENIWSYFDQQWSTILAERGKAPYMHMAAAIQHSQPFELWDAEKTDFLIQGLLGLLMEVNQNKEFCGFRCTVDLASHRKYAAANNIPPVAQLCANLAFSKVYCWYADFPALIVSAFDLFFDHGDPFLNVLMHQWNNREIRREYPWWNLVRTIEPAEMQTTPAIQAADMLAWAHNRLKTGGPSGWAGRLAMQISQSVECWHHDLGEEILALRRFPNKYGFYT